MRNPSIDSNFVKADLEDKATKRKIVDAAVALSKILSRKVSISQVVNATLTETEDFVGVFLDHEDKKTSKARENLK